VENPIVACVHCGTKNRISPAGTGQVPVCGKCRNSLPWLVSATDQSFASELQAAVPVLVDFWAEWCGPCRTVAPALEELAREEAGNLKVIKVNVDENPVVSGQYRIQSIPTLILFRDGRTVETVIGAMSKPALLARLKPHLAA
jgi:thioredoxin 2